MQPRPRQQSDDTELASALADAVRRVRAGDKEAFKVLVEGSQRQIFRAVSRFARDRDEAMEFVQLALVQAFEQLHTLENPEAFRAWACRIGVRAALSAKRTQNRRPTINLDDAPEPAQDAIAERELMRRQQSQALRQALPSLTPMQRDVVTLRIDGEHSYREIAEALGSTEGAVRVHFHNAVTRLRDALSRGQHQEASGGSHDVP